MIRVNLGAVASVEPGVTSSVDTPFGLAASGGPEASSPSASASASVSLRAGLAGRRREVATTAPPSDRFEDRFDDLAAVAYRVVFRLLGSRPDAEDLTQETLTRAYQRWRSVRGHAEPWVARVAANLALDAIRRGKRRPTVSDTGGQERTAPAGPSVVDRIELVQGLRNLPKRQREVVVLRYIADLPEVAVAAELGISVGSVKQHASRGLAALRITTGADGSARSDGADSDADRSTRDTGDAPVSAVDAIEPAAPDQLDQEGL